MMTQNFENNVKNAFENFEAEVNPDIWMNIQQGIQVTAPSPAQQPVSVSAVVKTSLSISKLTTIIVAASAIVVVSVIGIWINSTNEPEIVKPAIEAINTRSAESQITSVAKPITGLNGNEKNNDGQWNGGEFSIPVKKDGKKIPAAIGQPAMTQGDDLNKPGGNPGSDGKPLASNQGTSHGFGTSVTDQVNNAGANAQSALPVQKEVKSLIDSYSAEPIAYIVANPVSGNAPLTVNFLNNGYARISSWDFGDGAQVVTDNQPIHIFKEPGTYTVKLTATDKNNRTATNEMIIVVKDKEPSANSSLAEIQNVFTPNGDGFNDVFRVKGTYIASVHAILFTASGQQVYQWSGMEGFWDGKFTTGNEAPEGSYYYIIEAVGTDSKVFRFKGVVRLIR